MKGAKLSVIIRHHDCTREFELERALMSVMMQAYSNIEVILITQRFSHEQVQRVEALVATLQAIDETFLVRVVNYINSTPTDARTALLNKGIAESSGRYLAFLDYDDVMHKRAYERLIDVLEQTKSAIVFGGIAVKFASLEKDFCLLRFRKEIYAKPYGLVELFQDNHCPIHSFVIDRSIVERHLLLFDESVQRAEDWRFLLKICARYRSDFSLKTLVVGDYFFKDDGSNTAVTSEGAANESIASWIHAAEILDLDRAAIALSLSVQRSLSVRYPHPELTISQFLAQIGRGDPPKNFVSQLRASEP